MAKTKTLEKKFGSLAQVTFKADISVDKCDVELTKGYEEGFTGADLKIGGVGITDIEYIASPDDEDCQTNCDERTSSPLKKCTKVKVNFVRFVLFIFRQNKTIELGRVCATECCCYGKDGILVS